MKLSELEQLTLTEIEQLAPLDLESEVQRILERYRNSEIPLTAQMVKKLENIARISPESCRHTLLSVHTLSEALTALYNLVRICNETGISDLLRKAIAAFLDSL